MTWLCSKTVLVWIVDGCVHHCFVDCVGILGSSLRLVYTFTLLNEVRHRSLSRKTVRISSTVISWFLLIVLSTSVSTFGFNDNDANVSVRVFDKLGARHDSEMEWNNQVLFKFILSNFIVLRIGVMYWIIIIHTNLRANKLLLANVKPKKDYKNFSKLFVVCTWHF